MSLRDAPELLTRKEVCFYFKRGRTTVWLWEKEGAPFIDGRIEAFRLAFWLEQRDAARRLGIEPKTFFAKPRRVREKLLQAAVLDVASQKIPSGNGS